MKHHILSRTLSLSAAAVMSLSVIGGSGMMQAAAVQTKPQLSSAPHMPQNDSSEPVTVIVKVSGDAVMNQPEALEMGSDYLETEQAKQLTAQCKAIQQSVQDSIRQLYPALKVNFSYSTLYNGFSCELPENLIEQVKALPDVVDVTVMENIAVPQMDRAAALSGFPAYYDMTGCSGEGQVIAVIDSELDTTHPMFAPLADDIEAAVSKEDVAEVISSGILNREVDPDRAYISNKLPFVVNYRESEDPYDTVRNELEYHGTHVSGIAAGNAFTASDGTELCGIARDAQLMFFGVSAGGGVIDGAAGLAAIEDAVKLHADVINMSWGADDVEYWGNNPYSEAISAADRAGVIVFNAAGNADNGVYSWGEIAIPENPDTGMMGDKAELGSPIMMVASADNTGPKDAGAVFFNGNEVYLMPMMDSLGKVTFLSYSIPPGDYEYVDCGDGSDYDFMTASDLSGKIALVQRSWNTDANSVTANARAKGACGVLLIDLENPDGMEYVYNDTELIINAVSWLDGQAMLEAEDKVLTITGEHIFRDYATSVSSYTSWGVKQSLDLRPDIMGIGGRVRSAAYYEGDYTASGTSMATPYVVGCTAVLREYLKKLGVEMTGSEFAAYVRRLLMNSATPYEEGGVFVTPRRQGAGLVSLDKAVAAKVLMTGDAGDAKVNLFDKIGDNFSFDVTLTNYSSEDVTFPQGELRLTTDGTYYDTYLEIDRTAGQQKLKCTTDFSGPLTVEAGETLIVKVSVSLDTVQCRKLEEKFKYGFFTEGYLMLSGAENSADISIPVLGYHGDWAQIPITDPETDSVVIRFGLEEYSAPMSVVRMGLIYKNIIERTPEKELYRQFDQGTFLKGFDVNYQNATKEEKKQLDSNSMECWISPNRDSIADTVNGFRYEDTRRNNAQSETTLFDADGNVVNNDGSFQYENFEKLEEGDYTLLKKRWINYPGSEENPQVLKATIHVDKTTPKVTYDYTEEDGRTYLVIDAVDEQQLQGLVVSGIGDGGEAGVYQPGKEKNDLRKRFYAASFYPRCYGGMSNMVEAEYENVGSLPFVLRCWGKISESEEGTDYDFTDVLAAEPDEDGIWTVKYDVTDLTTYSVTVMDEAYNFVEIRSSGNAAEELVSKKGFWADPNHGCYVIGDNTFTYTSYFDASVTEYSYTAEGDMLTLVSGSETKEYNVWHLSESNFQLKDLSDNSVMDLSGTEQTRERFEGKSFIPVNAILEDAVREASAFHGQKMEVTFYSLLDGWLTIFIEGESDSGFLHDSVHVNILNGRGLCTYNVEGRAGYFDRNVMYCQEYLSVIPAGLYNLHEFDCMLVFNEDGESGTIMTNGYGNNFELWKNTPFTYTLDENGSFTFCFNDNTWNGNAVRDMDYGEILIDFPKVKGYSFMQWHMDLITDDMDKIANLRSFDEMGQLATAYINTVLDTDHSSDRKQSGLFGYYLGWGPELYCIDIDPFTLDVSDIYGNTGNLLNPAKMPDNAVYTLDEIKKMAVDVLKERTGLTPEYIMTIHRDDGTIMVIFRDMNDDILEIYIADPVTGSIVPKKKCRGDVNCDNTVDVADAVMLARMLAEDKDVVVTAEGRDNADCDLDFSIGQSDVVCILRRIARLIRF